MKSHTAFHGTIIHAVSVSEVQVLESGLIVIDSAGKIVIVEHHVNAAASSIDLILRKHDIQPSETKVHSLNPPTRFLIPGFIDTHNHAPQFTQRGMGLGIPLLTWLKDITFAHEARYADPHYARQTYTACVESFLRQGVTTACYYGSLHGPATKILAEICLEKGQRAFVGKCNMDRNAVDSYTDASAEESLAVTKDFISHVRRLDPPSSSSPPLVQPILTPRFAISCSDDLLTGLGHIAQSDPTLMIQTHFNEAPDEIAFTWQLFPSFTNEVDLYAHYNLLTQNTILAHTIFNSPYETAQLVDRRCGIAHCPASNTTIPTFMAAPIRHLLSRGLDKIGLGTDSGGGFSSSILEAARLAFIVSNARQTYHSPDPENFAFRAGPPHHHHHQLSALETQKPSPSAAADDDEKPLSLRECFYLATLGGARVCNLSHVIGNFMAGKEFDGLVIDMAGNSSIIPSSSPAPFSSSSTASTPIETDTDTAWTVFEKFMWTGDDRNIAEVWVRGRRVK